MTRLPFFFKKRRLVQSWTSKWLNLFLQSLNCFLILAKSLFHLKAPIKVSYPTDQNSQEEAAEDDQKEGERDFWNFEPLIIFYWEKNKTKGDGVLILNTKEKKK